MENFGGNGGAEETVVGAQDDSQEKHFGDEFDEVTPVPRADSQIPEADGVVPGVHSLLGDPDDMIFALEPVPDVFDTRLTELIKTLFG